MPDHVQELSFLLGYLMLALLEGNGGGYTYRRVSWQENTGMVGTCEAEYGLVGAFFPRKTCRPRSFGRWWSKGKRLIPCHLSPGFMGMTVYWVVH